MRVASASGAGGGGAKQVSRKKKEGRKKEDEDARENDRLMEIESFVSCSLSVNFPSSDICNKRFIVINNRFLYCKRL